MEIRVSLLVAILAVIPAFAVISASPSHDDRGDGLEPHLVGGGVASILKYDYFVGFSSFKQWNKRTTCGGIRLNEKWVLTVADCFDSTKFNTTKITFVENYSYLGTTYRDTRALKVIKHPKFDAKTNAHRLVLVNSTEFDGQWTVKHLHPALPTKNEQTEIYLKGKAHVTSVNTSRDPLNFSEVNKLTVIAVDLKDPKFCQGYYDPTLPQSDQICTIPWVGDGLEEGDIGVPLVKHEFRAKILIGLATIVKPVVKDDQPLVFTKIGPYVDWITKVTGIKLPN